MKSQKIYRYDLNGNLVAEYASMREFERATGICRKRAGQLKLVNKGVEGKDLKLIQYGGNSNAKSSDVRNIIANVVITNDTEQGRFILFDAPVNFK